MNLISALKLVFSETAFHKAELDNVQAKIDAGGAWTPVPDFYSEALRRVRSKRQNLRKSAFLAASLVFIGAIAATWVNATDPWSWISIRLTRAFTVTLLAWAVWSKIGDVETFKKETLLEMTSQYLYERAYRLGILLTAFALFLEGSDSP